MLDLLQLTPYFEAIVYCDYANPELCVPSAILTLQRVQARSCLFPGRDGSGACIAPVAHVLCGRQPPKCRGRPCPRLAVMRYVCPIHHANAVHFDENSATKSNVPNKPSDALDAPVRVGSLVALPHVWPRVFH